MADDDEEELKQVQRHYELLGAPCLLYRNYESYSLLDERVRPYENNNKQKRSVKDEKECDYLSRKRRVQARWYYPMDYHMIKRANLGRLNTKVYFFVCLNPESNFGNTAKKLSLDASMSI